MEAVNFERQFRTTHSEGYYITRKDERIGRVDLHFATEVVYATLVVEVDTSEDDILDLIEYIDEELVLTADVLRDDFLVTVYRGTDLGFYSDDYFGDREDEDEEDDEDKDEDEEDEEDEEEGENNGGEKPS